MQKLAKPVLVVEDDETIQELIKSVAERMGVTVRLCGSAEEGQLVWKEQKNEFVILDLKLPGMSGIEFTRWIRSQQDGRDTFILISTSNTKFDTFQQILAEGANDYIPKPLQAPLLAIRIGVALNMIDHIKTKQSYKVEVDQGEIRFKLLSENSRDLICTHDPNGILTYVSPSCKNLLGYSQNELLGKSFDNIKIDLSAEPLNKNAGRDEANGILESTSEWRVQHNEEDKEIWLETYTQAIRDGQNIVKEIYSYSRDVTEKHREDEQLQILSVMGESTDSESFLDAILSEMENKLNAKVCIHIHALTPDSLSYHISVKGTDDEINSIQKAANKGTPHDKPLFQGNNAANVFHYIEGLEGINTLIVQPILGTFGTPIGKMTIISPNTTPDSERTKAVIMLCASKIGCILEEHLTRS